MLISHLIVFFSVYYFCYVNVVSSYYYYFFFKVLYAREGRLKERLGFLRHLDRAQFNAKLPGYVSPYDIAATSDEVFLEKVAKSTPEEYENYLKLH